LGDGWVVDAYPLPYRPWDGVGGWAAATVEVWTDRVVVQVVAPREAAGDPPWRLLGLDCDWTLGYASGATVPLWSGAADDGEGTVRCHLLFGGRPDGGEPVSLRGRLDGVPVEADLRRRPG
jgi:hypothetical protein